MTRANTPGSLSTRTAMACRSRSATRGSQTRTMPSSETGFSASSSGPSSISLWAAPEGIIGKQFSAGSTATSRITARSAASISLIAASTSAGRSTRSPTAPKASANLTKSGSAAVQQLLPLPHHAHVLVVEDEHLDREPVLRRSRHFLDVHQDRGLAGDVDDKRLRVGDLHPDSRRQAVAHRAE